MISQNSQKSETIAKRRFGTNKPAPISIPSVVASSTDSSKEQNSSDRAVNSPKEYSPNSSSLVAPCPIKSPLSKTLHWFEDLKSSDRNTQIPSSAAEAKAENEIRNILLKSPKNKNKNKHKSWDLFASESLSSPSLCEKSPNTNDNDTNWLLSTPPPPFSDYFISAPFDRPSNPLPADKRFPHTVTPPPRIASPGPRRSKPIKTRQTIGAELGIFRLSPSPSEFNRSFSSIDAEDGMFQFSPSVEQMSADIQGRA